MKKIMILVLFFTIGLSFTSVGAIANMPLMEYYDGGGGGYSDPESNYYSSAKEITFNSSTYGTFQSSSDVDYFTFKAPYNGRIRVYTTGYANSKITVHERGPSVPGYSYYYTLGDKKAESSDNVDHADTYTSSWELNMAAVTEERSKAATSNRSNNAYATFFMEKDKTYYIRLDNENSYSGVYDLKLYEDAYCSNPATDSRYNIASYTKLMLNGVVLSTYNFDAIENGEIDYLFFGDSTSEVTAAAKMWNEMSAGPIFSPGASSLGDIELLVIEIDDLPNGSGVYLSMADLISNANLFSAVVNNTSLSDNVFFSFLSNVSVSVAKFILQDYDLRVILVESSSHIQSTIAHEMGHSLGYGDMYNTVLGGSMEGRMNLMESSTVTEAGMCDLYIYNKLFN